MSRFKDYKPDQACLRQSSRRPYIAGSASGAYMAFALPRYALCYLDNPSILSAEGAADGCGRFALLDRVPDQGIQLLIVGKIWLGKVEPG
jgi:hypothetical protein